MRLAFVFAWISTIWQLAHVVAGNELKVLSENVRADGDVTVAWNLAPEDGLTRMTIVLIPDIDNGFVDRSPLFGAAGSGEFSFSLSTIQVRNSILFEAVEWKSDDTMGRTLARSASIPVGISSSQTPGNPPQTGGTTSKTSKSTGTTTKSESRPTGLPTLTHISSSSNTMGPSGPSSGSSTTSLSESQTLTTSDPVATDHPNGAEGSNFQKGSPIGAIIGGVVGGFLLILIAILVCFPFRIYQACRFVNYHVKRAFRRLVPRSADRERDQSFTGLDSEDAAVVTPYIVGAPQDVEKAALASGSGTRNNAGSAIPSTSMPSVSIPSSSVPSVPAHSLYTTSSPTTSAQNSSQYHTSDGSNPSTTIPSSHPLPPSPTPTSTPTILPSYSEQESEEGVTPPIGMPSTRPLPPSPINSTAKVATGPIAETAFYRRENEQLREQVAILQELMTSPPQYDGPVHTVHVG